ncbi:MAG: ribosome small subunit-dependent GTPase A, partial [Flavobacteriales bacterium CG_4_9_14_0_2_um_filter_32_27]
MEEGIVIKSTGNLYHVRLKNGEIITTRIKGSFRMMDIKTTNPVAVGDKVVVNDVETDPVISEIKPRTNYIIRKSVNLSKQAH